MFTVIIEIYMCDFLTGYLHTTTTIRIFVPYLLYNGNNRLTNFWTPLVAQIVFRQRHVRQMYKTYQRLGPAATHYHKLNCYPISHAPEEALSKWKQHREQSLASLNDDKSMTTRAAWIYTTNIMHTSHLTLSLQIFFTPSNLIFSISNFGCRYAVMKSDGMLP